MNNFEYSNPTKLVFGKGQISKIGQLMKDKAGEGAEILVVYGGGSVVKNGILADAEKSLTEAGLKFIPFGGVHPNPSIEKVYEGIDIARKNNVKAILAVGGGSVIDTAKAIALGVPYDGDVWDFFLQKATPKTALPVAAVLTIPAAGSEQSIRVVINGNGRKLGIGTPVIRPFVALIDPEYFFTLPQNQIRAGVIDMMSHIMERYFTPTKNTDFVDGQAEAAMRSIMKNGLIVEKDPKNYDAWSQLGLAGSFAHNGYYSLGQVEDWASHGMEHELSAWNDHITHGLGLAVVTPAWLEYVTPKNPERVAQFAVNVMGVKPQETPEKTAEAGIEALRKFYKEMGAPATLKDIGAENVDIHKLAEKAVMIPGKLGNFVPLKAEDIEKIYALMR
ncbi:MAG: iron-containing alcohol dehydrogenase [Burkholderiales bacterium]|nr:iron-containing alcohol dehydrogenase [Burkholderiales bacterium]